MKIEVTSKYDIDDKVRFKKDSMQNIKLVGTINHINIIITRSERTYVTYDIEHKTYDDFTSIEYDIPENQIETNISNADESSVIKVNKVKKPSKSKKQ